MRLPADDNCRVAVSFQEEDSYLMDSLLMSEGQNLDHYFTTTPAFSAQASHEKKNRKVDSACTVTASPIIPNLLRITLFLYSPKYPQALSLEILKVCSPGYTLGFLCSDRHIIQPTRTAEATNTGATTHGQPQIHSSYSKELLVSS